ncbi:hypothetical protein HOR97_gp17 [Agrobacterium phage Atu_ph03]|uniref:Uncharacterized protein n=2 Tax=Atuphduovirus TaxID=2731928 RepID=A0A2L0UYX4_9CAUD|nr:hypothetical protein HOR96_gp15 [Agrobacterium phage Atu_ph02]YP_009791858.1 hypothetical protein HOR97_gp17 [Agrobacterium phage Atu_ph03]AUZ94735.1 hypothetical protein [Agrobacterium phage Atu_ph02]AUZ94776.1 hypothetical protein [Agrobacterium phage Atu_ph03]
MVTKFVPPVPPEAAPPMTKPRGLHCRYVFADGKHLNIFGVQDINVDGEWYRVRDGKGSLFIINKDAVLYIEQKTVE